MSPLPRLSERDLPDEGVYPVWSMCNATLATRRVLDSFTNRGMHVGPMPLDYPATLRSHARTLELGASPDCIVPGHDPKVRALYPPHEIAGIELSALHAAPLSRTSADVTRTDDLPQPA